MIPAILTIIASAAAAAGFMWAALTQCRCCSRWHDSAEEGNQCEQAHVRRLIEQSKDS